MELSEERMQELFNSISGPITELRIQSSGGFSVEELDKNLYKLQFEIWNRAKVALNIKGE